MKTKKKKSRVGPEHDESRPQKENERVERFEIVLVNCHDNTYHPGQLVEGHVALDLTFKMVTRGLVLQFTGLVELHWSEKVPGRGARCVDTVEYQAAEEYFNVRNYLQEPGQLEAGRHQYPFRFHLTPPLPETYADNVCTVTYRLEARLKQDSLTRHDLYQRREILVLAPLDLNKVIIPDVTLPMNTQRMQTVTRWCRPHEELVVYLRLPRAGYAPGETIHVQADIDNESSREITSAVFNLVEERKYHADDDRILEHRDTLTTETRGPVAPGSVAEWRDVDLTVPKGQLFNVSASQIFTISHFVEMGVKITGVRKPLVLRLDVVLGAIPLDSKTLDTPTHARLQTPTKQHRRPTVQEIEAQRNLELLQSTKTRLARTNHRQRKKASDKRPVPDEETDTTDYHIQAEELDLYKHTHKQGYLVRNVSGP